MKLEDLDSIIKELRFSVKYIQEVNHTVAQIRMIKSNYDKLLNFLEKTYGFVEFINTSEEV